MKNLGIFLSRLVFVSSVAFGFWSHPVYVLNLNQNKLEMYCMSLEPTFNKLQK